MTKCRECARCKTERLLEDFLFEGKIRLRICRFCSLSEKESTETKCCTKCRRDLPIHLYPARELDKYRRRQSQCKDCRTEHLKTIDNPVDPNLATKVCYGCQVEKPVESYSKSRKGKDGYQTKCKACHADYARKTQSLVLCSFFSFSFSLRAIRHKMDRYGTTYSETLALLADSQGVCAICQTPFKSASGMHFDHDHATGKIRGVLCYPCNMMLGVARDSVQILGSGVAYLNRHAEDSSKPC